MAAVDRVQYQNPINNGYFQLNGNVIGDLTIKLSNQTEKHRKKIVQWLYTANFQQSYYTAISKHEPNTGQWFLRHHHFEEWKAKRGSLLWLSGKPGCGKTVLSSAIIRNLRAHCEKGGAKRALAYFFFEFKDVEKQDTRRALSSLVRQLLDHVSAIPLSLNQLYEGCEYGKRVPDIEGLMVVLKTFAESDEIDDVFVVLDALDECPEDGRNSELLSCIEQVQEWTNSKLHLLVTSRPEPDIQEFLTPLLITFPALRIEGSNVDADIAIFTADRLSKDRKLKTFQKSWQGEITKKVEGARGMFQWVACLLDELRDCKTEQQFYSALEQFPQTLDETYARILMRIKPEDRKQARRALLWLAHSQRPLRIDEFAEAIVVDPGEERLVESYTGFSASDNMLEILGSLVVTRRRGLPEPVESLEDPTLTGPHRDIPGDLLRSDQVQEVFLSHFSVKEYLTSRRIMGGDAEQFRVNQLSANRFIARSSLRYIFHYDSSNKRRTSDDLVVFPLLRYACTFWYEHAKSTPIGKPNQEQASVDECIHQLFDSPDTALLSWLRVHRPDERNWEPFEGFAKYSLGTPLHYAAFLGLPTATRRLLEKRADPNATNDEGYTPLHGAVLDQNNTATVQALLEGQANPNAKTNAWRTPLMFAVQKDCRKIIKLLLDANTEVEAADKGGWTALYWSAQCHRVEVLQSLIAIGANVDPRTTSSGTPLHQVSGYGYQVIMRVLLEHGADCNAIDVRGETPLFYAAKAGKAMAVLLLLEFKAKLDWKDLKGFTALDKAKEGGHVEVVQLLKSVRSVGKSR